MRYTVYDSDVRSIKHSIMPTPRLLLKASLDVKTISISSHGDATDQQLLLLQQYNQLRTEYVLQEKWPIHASGIDLDIYDVASHNHYVIAYVKNRVVAGMRLTRVSSVVGSLSYSMWQFAEEREKFEAQLAERHEYIKNLPTSNLWDVTRLVSESSILGEHSKLTRAHSKVGLFKAMAQGINVVSKNDEAIWMFTIAEKMLHFMQRNDIRVDVLAQARISTQDAGESYFCVVKPQEVLEVIAKKRPMLYLVVRSITKRGK